MDVIVAVSKFVLRCTVVSDAGVLLVIVLVLVFDSVDDETSMPSVFVSDRVGADAAASDAEMMFLVSVIVSGSNAGTRSSFLGRSEDVVSRMVAASDSDKLVECIDDTLVLSTRVDLAQPEPMHNKQTTNSIISLEENIFDSLYTLVSWTLVEESDITDSMSRS